MLKLKGRIESGVARGSALVDTFFFRLIGILGYEPYKGTLNVKLERAVDIERYSSREISHILKDGKPFVHAYLVPVVFTVKGQSYECWVISAPKQAKGASVEILAKDNLHQKFGLKDGDEVELAFFEKKRRRRVPGMDLIAKLYGYQPQLGKG